MSLWFLSSISVEICQNLITISVSFCTKNASADVRLFIEKSIYEMFEHSTDLETFFKKNCGATDTPVLDF